MKKLLTFSLCLIALFSHAHALEEENFTVLIPGSKKCTDGTEVASKYTNVRVSLPDAALSNNKFTWGDLQLSKAVTITTQKKTCTLDKGTVLERAIIELKCIENSVIDLVYGGQIVESYDLGEKENKRTTCGGNASVFKRVSQDDIYFEDGRYFVQEDANIILTDNMGSFGRTTDGTQYTIPFVSGTLVKSGVSPLIEAGK
ncbi:MAG: hypothetical protein KDD46_05550 [Bdellovibrionales bacterium]|nr:hypothetical protein [Bdellovibrionales bacterium]